MLSSHARNSRYQPYSIGGLPFAGTAIACCQNPLTAAPVFTQAGFPILCEIVASTQLEPSHTRTISHNQAKLVLLNIFRASGGSSKYSMIYGLAAIEPTSSLHL